MLNYINGSDVYRVLFVMFFGYKGLVLLEVVEYRFYKY